MTMLWCEGFETFGLGVTNAEIEDVYDFNVNHVTTATIVTGRPLDGYADERAIEFDGTITTEDESDIMSLPLGGISSGSTWIVALALKVSGTAGFATGRGRLIYFADSEGDVLAGLCLNANGSGLSVRRGGSGGTELDTHAVTLNLNDWYYIEFKITFHGSTGSFEVKLGVGGAEPSTVMSDTNVNTTATGGTRPYELRLGGRTTGALGTQYTYDDWVVMDDAGSVNNDFLGDVQIIKIRPNAVGDQTDLDTSSAVDNYTLVNEDTEDGDTSYVETNTVNAFDLYHYENILLAGDIFAAVPKPVLKKDPSGTRSFRTLCKSNGTTENGAEQFPSSGSYVRRQHVYEQDPDGPMTWTVAAINAAQWGIQLVS